MHEFGQGDELRPPSAIVYKDDIKRRITTQPLADAVVTLSGTVLPQEEHPHFYVAEAPVLAGLNPLLLVIESSNGGCEFRNVLAVLPAWKIHSNPCHSAFYRAALGCVRAKYRTLITALRPSNLGKTLPADLVDGRHCGNSVPSWLAKPLGSLIEDAVQCDVSSRLISEVSELLVCRQDNDPDVVPWNVLHLHSDEPNSAADPDWYIFNQWRGWEAKGFGLAECFAEFKQKHKKPSNKKAFNTHLRYLGLPTPRGLGPDRGESRAGR